MKKLFFFFFSIYPLILCAQVKFDLNDTIAVSAYGKQVLNPWAGGINFPEWSEIDLNQDGNMDLFMFDRSNNRLITLINDGSPGTGAFHDSTAKYAPMFPKLSGWAFLYDYNNDGLQDLFTVNDENNGILQFKASYNSSAWTFIPVDSAMLADYGSGQFYNILASANLTPNLNDIDNDGDMDILGQQFLCVGTFAYYRNMSMEHYGVPDSLDDFKLETNSWGHFGLRGGGYCYVDVGLYNVNCRPGNNPDPIKFQHEIAQKDDTYAVLFTIDLDGDGDKDALLGDSGANNILALTNSGDSANANMIPPSDTIFPSYDVPVLITSFANCGYADVDNDGKKDLLVGNSEYENKKGVFFYKNNGTTGVPVFNYQHDSLFQSSMIDVGEAASPVFFDADGDGLLDIIIAGILRSARPTSCVPPPSKTSLTLYRNVGSNTDPMFQFITDDYAGIMGFNLPGPIRASFGDLDGDGDLDMLIGQGNGLMAYFNNTAGCSNCPANFQFVTPSYMNIDVGNVSSPQLVDLDQDGQLDFVIGNQGGILRYYRNTGSTTSPAFASTPTIDTLGGIKLRPPAYVDGYTVPYLFNDSGQYKLLVSCMQGDVFLYDSIDGNLNGVWNLADTILTKDYGNRFGYNLSVSGGDINTDGFTDMLLGLYGGGIQIFYRFNPNLSVHNLNRPDVSFSVFPNPASETLNLSFYHLQPGQNYSLNIFNAIGEVILFQKISSKNLSIDVRNFSSGIYLIRLQSGEQSITSKVIISHQ